MHLNIVDEGSVGIVKWHLLIVTAELEGLQGPLQAADVCTSRNHTHLSTDWTVVSCMSIRGGQSAAGDVLVEGSIRQGISHSTH